MLISLRYRMLRIPHLGIQVRAGRAVFAAALLYGSLVLPTAGGAAGPARVALGTDTGMPGGPVVIPLSLSSQEELPIGSLAIELQLPHDLVELKAARISLATEIAGGEITAPQIEYSEKDKTDTVRLMLSAKRPLPNGTVASLEFRIAEKTGDLHEIRLKVSRAELTTLDGKRVDKVDLQDGSITISNTPPTLVNCFFFSH